MTKIEMELRGFLSKNQVLLGFRGLFTVLFYVKNDPFFNVLSVLILHDVTCKLMQYDSISILLK